MSSIRPIAGEAAEPRSGLLENVVLTRERVSLSPVVLASAAAGLALVAGLAWGLSRYSLWTDEAVTGRLMRRPFDALVTSLIHAPTVTESGQPLYDVLLWGWVQLVGNSEAGLRLPSLVFSIATAVVLSLALREIGVRRTVALISAPTILALPVIQWYALEARAYALIMLCASVHILLSLRSLRSGRHLALLAAWTVIVALSFTVAGIAALLAFWAVVTWTWSQAPNNWRRTHRLRLLLLTALASAAVAVLVIASLWSVGTLGSYRAPIGLIGSLQSLAISLYEWILGRSTGLSVLELRGLARLGDVVSLIRLSPRAFVVATVGMVGGIAIALNSVRRIHWRHDPRVLIATAPWLLLAFMFCVYTLYPGFLLLGRHILFAFPAVVLLVALGVSRSAKRIQLVAVAFVWCLGLASFLGFAFDQRYAKEDFRSAARIATACGFQPNQVFLLSYRDGFAYYGIAGREGVVADTGDTVGAVSFLRSAGGDPALLIEDSSRFDPRGTIEAQARETGTIYRRDVPSLTLLSTVPLDSCGA